MSGLICVDANVVVKLYTYEEYRDAAVELLEEADSTNTQIIAPDFIYAETASTIRKLVYRKLLTIENGALGLHLIKRLNLICFDVRDLYDNAWRIAAQFNLGSLYDAFYLALAEQNNCHFWTADERFINSVSDLAYVKNIKDFTPGMLES